MSFKYYLRGVGIGIVFTAIVLSIAHNEEVKKLTMTEAKIIEEAKKLGMMTKAEVEKVTNSTPDPSSESTLDSTPESISSPAPTPDPTPSSIPDLASNSTTTPDPASTPDPTTTPDPTSTPDPTPTPDSTSKPDPKETPELEYVTISITRGMWSKAVAKVLQDKGLVSSAEEFDKYLMDNGVATFIWAGTYEIEKGSTYSEITKKITGKR